MTGPVEQPTRVLVSDQLESVGMEILRDEGFEVDYIPGMEAEDLKQKIGAYKALVVRSSTKVTSQVIEQGRNLRVIGRAGTGVDNIDVDAATRKGILVINTPGGNTVSAAEHTVSMMLSLARNIPQAHISLTSGKWDRKRFVGMEVLEKTIGIIGLGQIGREVAKRSRGLGMFVIGYDPLMQKDAALKLGIELVSLDELYRRSDFITVHTPLTSETKGLINDAAIARCRKGVRFLNCARGGIIDESALLRGLQSGHVGGAALDVFEKEPPDHTPLFDHEKVIVTPHLGASTEEAQEKVAAQIGRQIADALSERAYAGVVNASILHLTIKEEVRPFLRLSEKMGSLAAQVLEGNVRGITVSAEGTMVSGAVDLLKAGALRGMLPHFLPDPVNIINAPFLAKEMGIAVREQRREDGRELLNSFALLVETDRGRVDLVGTVFGAASIRLVKIDRFRVEVNPEGYLLIYRNVDRPGFLAKVGSILAASNVNIGGVSLGRTGAGEVALTVMNIDDPISPGLLQELARLDGVTELKFADLGDFL